MVSVGHDCDVAVLNVRDSEFWAKPHPVQPLKLGDVPALQHAVSVVGFPQGGDNLSITTGVVSRVGSTQYVHGASYLLAIQIDGASRPAKEAAPTGGRAGSSRARAAPVPHAQRP